MTPFKQNLESKVKLAQPPHSHPCYFTQKHGMPFIWLSALYISTKGLDIKDQLFRLHWETSKKSMHQGESSCFSLTGTAKPTRRGCATNHSLAARIHPQRTRFKMLRAPRRGSARWQTLPLCHPAIRSRSLVLDDCSRPMGMRNAQVSPVACKATELRVARGRTNQRRR